MKEREEFYEEQGWVDPFRSAAWWDMPYGEGPSVVLSIARQLSQLNHLASSGDEPLEAPSSIEEKVMVRHIRCQMLRLEENIIKLAKQNPEQYTLTLPKLGLYIRGGKNNNDNSSNCHIS